MDARLDRRELLRAGAYAGGALILNGVPVDAWARRHRRRPTIPFAREGAFAEGVAAGAPKPRGIVLWTRLEGQTGDRRLRLEVARDPGFRRLVLRRDVVARAGADHTVKARVEGRKLLAPHQEYWYRFATTGGSSPVGRFRTLPPPDSRQPVRIAAFSCQDWQAGWYGAHRVIAADDDLDLVVCLGDYVYERNFYESIKVRQDTLGANRDGEVQTLDEYRAKYRLYRSDADLRAMHAAHPFVAIWDDHEVEDNYARDLPGEKTEHVRVPFLQRRAAGYRAWDEYMPFEYVGRGTRIYRSLRVGRNAELFLLDQRQYRDDQPCGDEIAAPCPEAETVPRDYLGREQLAWLKDGLRASGARWKLVGNQLMIMSLDGAPGNTLNKDSWDGYGLERRSLTEHVRAHVRDVAFLTGDIHLFGAGDVGIDGRGPESVATEFVCGSITSLGPGDSIPDEYGEGQPLPTQPFRAGLDNLRHANPHVKHATQEHFGYALVEARERELDVRFMSVPPRPLRSTQATQIARFVVAPGVPAVQQV
jgi:alkaline phosphatase D